MAFGWFKRKKDLWFDASNVPPHVMKLNDRQKSGPNCWNATMIFFNPSEKVRYVPPGEMVDWIHDNTYEDEMRLCSPGHIFAMSNDEQGLLHTAVWVAPGVLFHKRGIAGHWEFVTEKQIREIYFEATKFYYRIPKQIKPKGGSR